MSINTTDKNADNVETLVDNTNEAITLVNEQLDESVLNNLTTENTDTLVNAINELNETKLDKNATQILNDFTINGHLSANSIAVNTDADGNSVVYFYDTTSSSYLKLFWNNSVQKYQLVFPDGSIVDIANSLDVADLQEQIDNISSSINYNFNTNGQTLILKQMSSAEIASYVGPAGEIVINSEEWGEIRVQDGTTVGGIVISGSVFVKWASNIEIKKGQCVYYGEGLYRAKTTHTTNDVFDISLYDTLAAYKKFVEVQTTTEETDTFTLKQSVGVANDFDVNIGGLVIQKSNITVVDDYHIKLSEKVPANTDVEITYFTASNVINSSITTNLFVAEVDDTTEIPLQEEVINSNAVHEVNIENTVLLNSEWSLAEGNQKIILKNGVPTGTRVQVKFWKGVTVAQNGVTFTPSIVGGSTLTWENDGGLPNPDPISLMTQNSTQTISGAKTFTDIKVPTKDVDDSSSAAASTEFVRNVVDSARTNCITEIPQDIKLELNDGVLTLKAGSKVYVPNGFEADSITPKFDVVVIESDVTRSAFSTISGNWFTTLRLHDDGHFSLGVADKSNSVSGGSSITPPTDGLWYDTDTNKMRSYSVGAEVLTYATSLPLIISTFSSGTLSSIDQVFNGFGYIGSTVFALPGVKGLIPDGRNADGTLRNIEFTSTSVTTWTVVGNTNYQQSGIWVSPIDKTWYLANVYYETDGEPAVNGNHALWFNPRNNAVKITTNGGSTWTTKQFARIGLISTTGTTINSASFNKSFRALDRNDSSWISAQSAPSEKFINLSIGADKAQYTAPADGYVCFSRMATASNQSVSLYVEGITTYSKIYSSASNQQLVVSVRVGKGKKFNIGYSHSSSDTYLKFVYTEGEI